MSQSTRILVTGLSGFLGRALAQEAPANAELIGTTRLLAGNEPADRSASWAECDLEDPGDVERCLELTSPDVVIHAAGEANVDNVQRSPLGGISSNAIATMNIANACARRDIHLLYISSNAVFSGEDAPYAEDSAANPVNHYGLVKLVSERIAVELNPRTTVVRPILMYGWNDEGGRSNPVLMTITRLTNGEPIQMVDDVFENPLYVRDCAAAIWKIVAGSNLGVFHLAGGTQVNRYELAIATAREFGLDEALIGSVHSDAFPTIAPRPANTTFITERMEEVLQLKPSSLESGLALMHSHEQ
ncbi:MAG: SDR family oxidoreductase [Actinomycetota bacterium]